MSASGTDKLYSKRLRKWQREILLWLATKESRFTPTPMSSDEVLQRRADQRYVDFYSRLMGSLTPSYGFSEDDFNGVNQALDNRLDAMGVDFGGRLLPPDIQKPRSRGVEWDTETFLGRLPTPAERVTLHNSLKSLEARGLIIRSKSRGKRRRTSHVKLTEDGVRATQEIVDDDY